MADEYNLIQLDDVEPKPSASSGTNHIDLVEQLGCRKMRPKVWYLSPGDAMTYHRQTEQEEVDYVLDGPGRMKIEGESIDVPEDTVIRIPPVTNRQVLNDTENEHVWFIIGAPPVTNDGRSATDDA